MDRYPGLSSRGDTLASRVAAPLCGVCSEMEAAGSMNGVAACHECAADAACFMVVGDVMRDVSGDHQALLRELFAYPARPDWHAWRRPAVRVS